MFTWEKNFLSLLKWNFSFTWLFWEPKGDLCDWETMGYNLDSSLPDYQQLHSRWISALWSSMAGTYFNTWRWFICHSSGLTGTLAGEALLTLILRQTLKLSVSKRCQLPLNVSSAHAWHSEGAEYEDLSRCAYLLGKSTMLQREGTSLQGRQSGTPHLHDS